LPGYYFGDRAGLLTAYAAEGYALLAERVEAAAAAALPILRHLSHRADEIDSLAGIMDPIAERVITRVVCSVLAELFGETTILDGGQALADLPGLSPGAAPWARPPGGGA